MSPKDHGLSQWAPTEVRCTVTSQNQFNLPAFLVREVGFESKKFNPTSGAVVAWYYHEGDDKAVLSTKAVERPSLDFVGVSSLVGISNEKLETGVEKGARVTVISNLPEHLHEMLTRSDAEVVLKPIYASEYSALESTCVSVYPAEEYDRGELPNVDCEINPMADEGVGSSEGSTEVTKTNIHQNSI